MLSGNEVVAEFELAAVGVLNVIRENEAERKEVWEVREARYGVMAKEDCWHGNAKLHIPHHGNRVSLKQASDTE